MTQSNLPGIGHHSTGEFSVVKENWQRQHGYATMSSSDEQGRHCCEKHVGAVFRIRTRVLRFAAMAIGPGDRSHVGATATTRAGEASAGGGTMMESGSLKHRWQVTGASIGAGAR